VDESGTHTRMTPLYACAPRGRRAYGYAPRNHTRNTTLVAALTLGGVQESMAVEGAMDAAAFVAWLEQGLGPTLTAGEVVVMDNLSVHKGERVAPLIARAKSRLVGCPLGGMPAYSPDFTPIEQAFSKLKTFPRRAEARTREALEEAITAALATITATDAAGWFTACGYPLETDQ
jgi:transposase